MPNRARSHWRSLKYVPAKDFAPIGLAAVAPMLIVTRSSIPADNMKAVVDYVRQNQDKVQEAACGCRLAIPHRVHAPAIDHARVAYRGLAPVVNGLVGGHVDFACGDIGSFIGQLRAGTIKALGIASQDRTPDSLQA